MSTQPTGFHSGADVIVGQWFLSGATLSVSRRCHRCRMLNSTFEPVVLEFFYFLVHKLLVLLHNNMKGFFSVAFIVRNADLKSKRQINASFTNLFAD